MAEGTKGAAKVKHLGRRKTKIERYYSVVYPQRKIRRMLHNNGVEFARAWAVQHQALAYLTLVSRSMGITL